MTTVWSRSELHADVAIDAVWGYFADVARWPEWSPMCTACRLDGDLAPGARLAMRLAVAGLRLPVTSEVIAVEPPRRLAWRTRIGGIVAEHEYRFVAAAGGTLMINEESFAGVRAPLRPLLRGWLRRTDTHRRSLERLRARVISV